MVLSRAQDLADLTKNASEVPTQPADHGVQIFIRETTANTVRLAIVLDVDVNTNLITPQQIDLYLDGIPCTVLTQSSTRIHHQRGSGKIQPCVNNSEYSLEPSKPLGAESSVQVAEVILDRNTRVVDASAVWRGVQVDPGMVLVSDGTPPPLLTAEPAVLNFRVSTRLDPSTYTSPSELLSTAGAFLLALVPGPLIWFVLLLALYLLPKASRGADRFFRWLGPKIRPVEQDTVVVHPTTVTVEAKTIAAAIQAGLATLERDSASSLDIVILQRPARAWLDKGRPARLRMSARPADPPPPDGAVLVRRAAKSGPSVPGTVTPPPYRFPTGR
jgi:hypothetical protein